MTNGTGATHTGAKILVVDHNPTQFDELRVILEEAGFSVVGATNGKEGLAAVKANAIDLVITDIVMPEMDGFALCKALRADETCRHVPVILLTSLVDPRDVIEGLESGANNFISKPYDHPALLRRIHNVLANQELRKTAPSDLGISTFFAGQTFVITADRLQILDLLLSTYENAIDRNGELVRVRDSLRILNEQLEARVAARTAALVAEGEERRRAEEALRQLSARHVAILNEIPDIVMEVDANRVYTWANDVGREFFGDDVIGQGSGAYFAGRQDTYEKLQPLFVGDAATFYVESWQRRKDGQPRLLAWWCRALRDADGRVTGALSTARDITERQGAEEALRTEAERLSRTLEATSGGVWDWNILSGETVFSPRYSSMLGYAPAECAKSHQEWKLLVHPDDRERVNQEHSDHFQRNKEFSIEFRLREKSGGWHWVHSRGLLIERDSQGNPARMIGTHTDIQGRVQALEDLGAKTALLEAQANSTLDGILVVDPRGRKVFQNRRLAELWGIPPDVADDPDDARQVQHVMHSTRYPELFAERVRHLYGHPDETTRDEVELVNGRVLDRYSAPVLGKDGTNYGRIWSFRDVTERKQAEARMTEQLEELSRWHGATLGRENRVLELKKEVNALLAQAGQPPRYSSALEGGPEADE